MGWNDGPVASASISETFVIAVYGDGELILADGGSARIRAIRGGVVDTLAGGKLLGTVDGDGQAAAFGSPRGVAMAPDGTALIVDAREHALRRLTLPR